MPLASCGRDDSEPDDANDDEGDAEPKVAVFVCFLCLSFVLFRGTSPRLSTSPRLVCN